MLHFLLLVIAFYSAIKILIGCLYLVSRADPIAVWPAYFIGWNINGRYFIRWIVVHALCLYFLL